MYITILEHHGRLSITVIGLEKVAHSERNTDSLVSQTTLYMDANFLGPIVRGYIRHGVSINLYGGFNTRRYTCTLVQGFCFLSCFLWALRDKGNCNSS